MSQTDDDQHMLQPPFCESADFIGGEEEPDADNSANRKNMEMFLYAPSFKSKQMAIESIFREISQDNASLAKKNAIAE